MKIKLHTAKEMHEVSDHNLGGEYIAEGLALIFYDDAMKDIKQAIGDAADCGKYEASSVTHLIFGKSEGIQDRIMNLTIVRIQNELEEAGYTVKRCSYSVWKLFIGLPALVVKVSW